MEPNDDTPAPNPADVSVGVRQLNGYVGIELHDPQRLPIIIAQSAATNGRLFTVLLVGCDLTAVAVYGWRLYLLLALGGVALAGLSYLGDLLPSGPFRAALVRVNVLLGVLLLAVSLLGVLL